MRVGVLHIALDVIGLHVENALLAIGQFDFDPVFLEPAVDMVGDRVGETLEQLAVRKCRRVRVGEIGMRARRAGRRHCARHVGPHVIFGIGVGESRHQHRVGANHMIAFHEGFLRDLPVAGQTLDQVGRLVAPLERDSEVAINVAKEIFQWFTIRIGIDEYEAAPLANLDFIKAVRFFAHGREVPLARHFLQLAIQFPRPAVERAAQDLEAFLVRIAQGAAAMEAGIGEGLVDAFFGMHDDEGEASDVIDMRVTDIGNVVLVAGHLPDPFPQHFDLAVMFFLGVIAADLDRGHTRFHRRIFQVDRWGRHGVAFEDLVIGNAVGPIMASKRLNHHALLAHTTCLPTR